MVCSSRFLTYMVILFTVLCFVSSVFCFKGLEEGRIALITEVKGNVLKQESGSSKWGKVDEDTPLAEGDKIKTKKNSSAEITFIDDGQILRIEESSFLKIKSFKENTNTSILKLYSGKILSFVEKLVTPSSRFVIETPTAIAGVRSTEFGIETAKDETEIAVYSGKVSVEGLTKKGKKLGEVLVSAGMQTKVRKFKKPYSAFKMKKRWLKLKKRFPGLRDKLGYLKKNWQKLSPEQRKRMRKKLKQWKKLPQEEKKRVLKELREKVRKKREKQRLKRKQERFKKKGRGR